MNITATVSGVEFEFSRVSNIRNNDKHWQVKVVKTGAVMECFPGRTLEDKIRSIQNTAAVVGAERFKRDSLGDGSGESTAGTNEPDNAASPSQAGGIALEVAANDKP